MHYQSCIILMTIDQVIFYIGFEMSKTESSLQDLVVFGAAPTAAFERGRRERSSMAGVSDRPADGFGLAGALTGALPAAFVVAFVVVL